MTKSQGCSASGDTWPFSSWSYGFGEYIAQIERLAGDFERLVLLVAVTVGAILLAWQLVRDLWSRRT